MEGSDPFTSRLAALFSVQSLDGENGEAGTGKGETEGDRHAPPPPFGLSAHARRARPAPCSSLQMHPMRMKAKRPLASRADADCASRAICAF
eukprot:476072-Pleurochrysis_carterae.AAC.2